MYYISVTLYGIGTFVFIGWTVRQSLINPDEVEKKN